MKNKRVNRMERPRKIGGLGTLMLEAGLTRVEPSDHNAVVKDALAPVSKIHHQSDDSRVETTKKKKKKRPKDGFAPKQQKENLEQKRLARYRQILGQQNKTGAKMEKSIFDEADQPSVKIDPKPPLRAQGRKILEDISAKHIFKLRNPITLLDEADHVEMLKRNRAFERFLGRKPQDANLEEFITVGFDLGSTSTKIVIRFPFNASFGAFAIPAPPGLQADSHPYFWTTRIWQSAGGIYSLTDHPGATCFDTLKIDFLRATVNVFSKVEPSDEETRIVAFMALMLRQSLGWLFDHLKSSLSHRDLDISANFGFPAERTDDKSSWRSFDICGRAALHLALSKSEISNESVLKVWKLSIKNEISPNTKVIPEFIGAILGFFHSSRRREGQYMLCDFGGLTCDSVCFNFINRSDGTIVFNIYGGRVRSFGSEVVNVALKKKVARKLITAGVGSLIVEPIFDAWNKRGKNLSLWKKEMPLFVIGGGRHNKAYDGVFEWAENAVKSAYCQVKFYQEEIDLESESGLEARLSKNRSNARLLVAFGLSWSPFDMPDWLAPDQIIPPVKNSSDLSDRFVGKEQT
jgi:hypothetical protein